MPKTGDCPLGFGGAGVYRRDESDVAENCFYRPLATVTVQGAKWSTVGGEKFRLRENEFLAAAVDMPAQNYVIGASREKPFLSISLDLDKNVISGLLSEYPELALGGGECRGAGAAKIDGGLLGAFLRLYELSENPREAKFMAPILIREIHLRLLMGPLGGYIRAINTPDSSGHRISKAISWLRANYKEPAEICALAKMAGMSPASFHRHFKKSHRNEPPAIPQAPAAVRGAAPDARRKRDRRRSRLRRRLREPRAVQPRLQKRLRQSPKAQPPPLTFVAQVTQIKAKKAAFVIF